MHDLKKTYGPLGNVYSINHGVPYNRRFEPVKGRAKKAVSAVAVKPVKKIVKNKFKKKAVVINRNKSRLRGCIKTITAAINRTKDEDIINEWRYILSEIKLGLGIFD